MTRSMRLEAALGAAPGGRFVGAAVIVGFDSLLVERQP